MAISGTGTGVMLHRLSLEADTIVDKRLGR